MSDTHGDLKRALDPMQLSLRMALGYHVATGSCTQVLYKNKCSELLRVLLAIWEFSFPVSEGHLYCVPTVVAHACIPIDCV